MTHRRFILASLRSRRLFIAAENEARALKLPGVTLQTRIEMTENHRFFTSLGFAITAQTAHEGYNRPTSITMQSKVPI